MEQRWKINNLASNEAELLIYGDIGADWFGEGNDPKAFAQAISQVTAPVLNIRINSYGGDLFAGQAIHSMIKTFSGTKRVWIDGIAASAASVIAMAGDEVIMPANAMLMIHNAFAGAYGDSEDFKKLAADMEKINLSIVAAYQKKTGLDEATLKEMMNAETWMTAKEAVELGFADTLVDAIEVAAKLDGDKFFINGVSMPALPPQMLKQFINSTSTPKKEDKPMENNQVLSVEALKRDNAEIYNAIRNEAFNDGVKAERDRIKAIEEMELPGHAELINKAKFETGISAETLAVEMIKAEKVAKKQYLNNVTDDAKPLDKVEPTDAPATTEPDAGKLPENYLTAFKNAANKGVK